jgi:protein involved in polysaccharide export with SLBB domain
MNDDELIRKDPSDTRTYYDVAVDLEKAIGNPRSKYDIVLRDGDHLIVPENNWTVKTSGDVMCPMSINYAADKNMKYYIRNAGGFGKLASKSQTYVIYMNGSVNKLGRRAGSSKIEPGCEIVVPSKPKRNGWTPSETLSMATSILSLATIVVTLINTSK